MKQQLSYLTKEDINKIYDNIENIYKVYRNRNSVVNKMNIFYNRDINTGQLPVGAIIPKNIISKEEFEDICTFLGGLISNLQKEI